jgi:aminopeptidase N
MSGFSVLKNTYGELVLKDSTETNLISHELAHQWWGNRITCENWNHFWLNEAFATYMSAAYNEYRFGKEKYDSDIASYYKVYQEIKKRGSDKPLVFKDWSNPSQDDRNVVYFKGAYVLHCLRKEMGDESFWEGIKQYSKKHFGQLVTTVDFQNAMEESAKRNLDDFFKEWVY